MEQHGKDTCPWVGKQDNFDPYPDWSKLTRKQAEKFALGLARYRRASDALIADPANTDLCAEVIQIHHELGHVEDDILSDIWTIPVMVHVAGPQEWEEHPDPEDDRTALLQRCVRCKSVLSSFSEGMVALTERGPQRVSEDDMTWWEEGTQVAKSKQDAFGMQMYEIPKDRQLEKHEMECVGLPNMEGE